MNQCPSNDQKHLKFIKKKKLAKTQLINQFFRFYKAPENVASNPRYCSIKRKTE